MPIFILFITFVVFSVIVGGMFDSDFSDALFIFGVFGVVFLWLSVLIVKLFL